MSNLLKENDFIGFTIGGYTSEELGITRVSDGSRYTYNILPTFSDQTIQVPGGNQTIYFRTDYTDKPFDISIAFDHMTETQLNLLYKIFRQPMPQRFVFNEFPYKYYLVRCSGAPQLQYLCFEENGIRIYKGEGTLSFVAYYPYGLSVNNFLGQFTDWYELTTDRTIVTGKRYFKFNTTKQEYELIPTGELDPTKISTYYEFLGNEWGIDSDNEPIMPFNSGNYNIYNPTTKTIDIYYNEEVPTNWQLKLNFINISQSGMEVYAIPAAKLYLDDELILEWEQILRVDDTERYILINTNSYTIEGYDINGNKKTLYNSYLTTNLFTKISQSSQLRFEITGNYSLSVQPLEYNYIYN